MRVCGLGNWPSSSQGKGKAGSTDFRIRVPFLRPSSLARWDSGLNRCYFFVPAMYCLVEGSRLGSWILVACHRDLGM